MPTSAIEQVGADHVVPAAAIGPLLGRYAHEPAPDLDVPSPPRLVQEVELVEQDDSVVEGDHPGQPSPWPCPDCHGVLWQIEDGDVLRFRCRVGHAWSAESLLAEQGESLEAALWVALRAMEDRQALQHTMAERADQYGRHESAARFREAEEEMSASVTILRRLLEPPGEGKAASA
jgi:two-component system chemotaxis response regulator CheB